MARLLAITLTVGLMALYVYGVPEAGQVASAFDAVIARYGAVWIALGGVFLLGLSLVWRQDSGRRRAPRAATTPAPATRPRLTLVSSEPHS